MCGERDELEAALSDMVGSLDTALLRGGDAKVLVGFYSRIERLASAGKSLCALRVAETGTFTEEGHRHVGEWLAAKTGESVGGAVSLLEAAGNLSKCPDVEEAFKKGELSVSQAKEVASAALMDPSAVGELLGLAQSEGFENLRRRCAQVKAAQVQKADEDANQRRIHRSRRLRTWTDPDGTFRLDARLTKDAGARILCALKHESDKIFSDARRAGARETSEAYLADALVCLLTRSFESPGAAQHPKALVHLRVDLAALRRGSTTTGEICEIEGVGPVSLATARELLGDSIAKLLVTSATDVHAICNLGRAVPKRLYSALSERDPTCVVPRCSARHNLEIDHRVLPFAEGGPTELANLARLCHHHHFLKTHEGYRLEGSPGAWIWVHPDGTRDGPGATGPPPPAKTNTDPPAGPHMSAGRDRPEIDRTPKTAQPSLFASSSEPA